MLGIRRDEQAVRGKERVFSRRSSSGEWDFRRQPPELWDQAKRIAARRRETMTDVVNRGLREYVDQYGTDEDES